MNSAMTAPITNQVEVFVFRVCDFINNKGAFISDILFRYKFAAELIRILFLNT